jgi:RimJ/RimL family protein N-acetyltransferase
VPELPLPDPPLTAGQVLLRPWTEADVPAIVAACQDPEIARWSPVIPSPYGEKDALEWLASQGPSQQEGRALELAVTSGESGEVIGAVALSNVELSQLRSGVGYWLAPRARGHGYATTAVRLLAGWGFDHLGLGRLELVTHPDNVASQRVAERCGFVREGVLRSHMLIRRSGQRRDSLIFGLLPGELR